MKNKLLLLVAITILNAHAMDDDKSLLEKASQLSLKKYCQLIAARFNEGIDPALHAFAIATIADRKAYDDQADKKIEFLTQTMRVELDPSPFFSIQIHHGHTPDNSQNEWPIQ